MATCLGPRMPSFGFDSFLHVSLRCVWWGLTMEPAALVKHVASSMWVGFPPSARHPHGREGKGRRMCFFYLRAWGGDTAGCYILHLQCLPWAHLLRALFPPSGATRTYSIEKLSNNDCKFLDITLQFGWAFYLPIPNIVLRNHHDPVKKAMQFSSCSLGYSAIRTGVESFPKECGRASPFRNVELLRVEKGSLAQLVPMYPCVVLT